ncbi:MAG: hypothetical protein RLZZ115_3001, partial [Cyanobacteriota bacterium]
MITSKHYQMITSKHYQELLGSAIPPELIDLNFRSLSGDEAVETVMYQKLDDIDCRTKHIHQRELNRIYKQQHLIAGGLWCAGLDPFDGWGPMQWGAFKPDKPRPDRKNPTKNIKYEHPPKVETRAFFPRVTYRIGLKIATKAGAEASCLERIPTQIPELNKNLDLVDAGFWQWVLENNIPIVITEGAKKTAALLSAGYAAIGLPGINGGVRTKDYNKVPCKPFLIPEIAKFATEDRTITICFDHDLKPKTIASVNREISKLSELLLKSKAIPKVIDLPGPEKGVDDFIFERGILAFDDLFINAKNYRYWQFKKGHKLNYKPNLILNQKYLGKLPYPARGMCFIKSVQGTGKTQSLIELIREAKETGRPVLVITHRIELGRAICEAIGINWIEDCKGSIEGKLFGFGLCVDSLHPLSQANFDPDAWEGAIVILDEVEQVLWHMINSSTCIENRTNIINSFELLIKNVTASDGLIIAQDADLSDYSIDYLLGLSSNPELKPYVIVNNYSGNHRDVIVYNQSEPMKFFMAVREVLTQGEKVLIVEDSQKRKGLWSAINSESRIKKLFPSARILRIDSETVADPNHPAFCCAKNINLIIKDYDVVIVTPTIGTGVSIDLKGHFAAVFGLFYGAITTHDAIQMMHRYRDPSATWHIWAKSVGVGLINGGCSFSGGIINSTNSVIRKNLELIGKSDKEGFDLEDLCNQRHTQLWAKMGARINSGMWNYRNNICTLLRDAGHRVTGDDAEKQPTTAAEKAVKNFAIETRDENRQTYAELVEAAEPVTENEYKALKDKKAKTLTELTQEKKYYLEDAYSIPVTSELVLMDEDGWLPKIKLHYYLLNPNQAKERDIRHLETAEKNGDGKFQIQDLKFITAKVRILLAFNILGLLDPDKIYTNESHEIVAIANALIGAKDIDYLGIKPNLKSSPMRIVQDLLRATLGFTLQSNQVKRDGKKIREYKFVGVGDKRYTIFEAWDKKTAEINEAMGVVPPFLYKDIDMVVPPELEETPPMNLVAPVPDIENLEGLILVNAETGRPDIVAKQSNYTTWITAKKDYISRNDVREGYYRLPNLADVVGWMKTTISD